MVENNSTQCNYGGISHVLTIIGSNVMALCDLKSSHTSASEGLGTRAVKPTARTLRQRGRSVEKSAHARALAFGAKFVRVGVGVGVHHIGHAQHLQPVLRGLLGPLSR